MHTVAISWLTKSITFFSKYSFSVGNEVDTIILEDSCHGGIEW